MKKPQSKKDIVIISSIMLAFIWLTILTGLFIWHYKGSEENYWNTMVEVYSNRDKIIKLEEKNKQKRHSPECLFIFLFLVRFSCFNCLCIFNRL